LNECSLDNLFGEPRTHSATKFNAAGLSDDFSLSFFQAGVAQELSENSSLFSAGSAPEIIALLAMTVQRINGSLTKKVLPDAQNRGLLPSAEIF